eukprot:TRINITY_DN88310_c0_g1_i1.p1 TRINITY_DN88310_c0_g1~~TRINITY_DN88310_c0_g1_i1.p1  ORF type:complete len:169 (-),score=34.78 TRINITY_DN88310_c0_g1_i1:76-549(-)
MSRLARFFCCGGSAAEEVAVCPSVLDPKMPCTCRHFNQDEAAATILTSSSKIANGKDNVSKRLDPARFAQQSARVIQDQHVDIQKTPAVEIRKSEIATNGEKETSMKPLSATRKSKTVDCLSLNDESDQKATSCQSPKDDGVIFDIDSGEVMYEFFI